MKPSESRGACLCGAVRFHFQGSPLSVYGCWCLVCQQLAAGGASINALVPRAKLGVQGSVSTFERVAQSGHRILHHFCPVCATQLFASDPEAPSMIVVRVGALEERASFAPERFIWSQRAPAWACGQQATPVTEEQRG